MSGTGYLQMRDLQVVSPPHSSECPYIKPKERDLLWGNSHLKSYLWMWQCCFLSCLLTRNAFFLLLTVSSSLASHWVPVANQVHVANLKKQGWCASTPEATTQSAAPRDRWPDRRTWLLDSSSETCQQEERVLRANFIVSELQYPRTLF